MRHHNWWLRVSLMACILSFASLSSAAVIISEYVEGSSYNKAIELYNPTDTVIDLLAEGYYLDIYFNGNTTANTSIELLGSIEPEGTYVIADDGAVAAIVDVADQTTASSLFNGDDAVVLFRSGKIVDSIGQVGEDPGSQWGSGDLSTQDNTLRRSLDITSGDTDPTDEVDLSEWEGFPQDTFDGLGEHTGGTQPDPPMETFIHEVQGAGESSPMVGTRVVVKGIVTADFQGSDALRGFFVQEEDADMDDDLSTSEGIFVFDADFGVDVQAGDQVAVEATVAEYYSLTELTNVTDIEVLASDQPLPTQAARELPLPDPDSEPLYLEAVEGMRVSFAQPLTVSETYNLGRYGEILLSHGRLMNPTNVAAPGEPALEVKAENLLNQILLDDASTQQNPDPIVYPHPELSADNTLRCGYTVTGLTGVMAYAYDTYRIYPTQPPVFEPAPNPRTDIPDDVGERLKVASFNVLNYFNGDGLGGGFPTSRGANTAVEFSRQRDKIVSAILAMEADVVGLMEIENDGYGDTSAIVDLVDALNAAAQEGYYYGVVDPGLSRLGTDEIAVGLIYNTLSVEQAGTAATLGTGAFADRNRQPLAQSFLEIATGETFTVVVNHFKSKGSSCDDIGDPDIGDGQGNCNLTRLAAAQELFQWMSTYPTEVEDNDILIIGDLNAYAMEDPISALKENGYTDLIQEYLGSAAYSYVFDGEAGYLDHALASAPMAAQVTSVTEWHINADEPRVLDYNTEYKSAYQIDSLYSPDAFRASDHDPVLIGLELTSVFSTKQCADLGDGPLHLPDVDFYSFTGKQNEKVSVRLQADPQAGGQGKRAGLILYSQDPGARLFRADMGRLPNRVQAVLPADGRYVIGIIGGSGRQSYKGAYCVTLTASYETSATLEPFWQNE
jgi:predicted extracellular nuclease